jgi:hypothetical protein
MISVHSACGACLVHVSSALLAVNTRGDSRIWSHWLCKQANFSQSLCLKIQAELFTVSCLKEMTKCSSCEYFSLCVFQTYPDRF